MAQVKFIATDLAKYNALAAKDPNTLYFIGGGVNQIFKGDQCFSGGVYKTVDVSFLVTVFHWIISVAVAHVNQVKYAYMVSKTP